MLSNSNRRTVSTTQYRPNSQILSRVLLFVFLGTGTCTGLFAQGKPQTAMKPHISLGVLIDTSAHQKKVIEFQREAVNSIADAFSSVATESFAVRYGEGVETLQEWSPLDPGLKNVSTRIELDAENKKNQRTLLYEALNVGLLKLERANRANSKVLIVVGEGNNAGGTIKYSEIAKRAKAAHVQCFALLVADHNLMGGRVRHFGFDLYDLASATKGKAYDVGDSRKNLDKAIRDMVKKVL
jgi:hypothetical protein